LEITFVRHHTNEETFIKGQCEIGANMFIGSILSSHDYLFPGAKIKPHVIPPRKNISIPFSMLYISLPFSMLYISIPFSMLYISIPFSMLYISASYIYIYISVILKFSQNK
jgi:hypothetical protein